MRRNRAWLTAALALTTSLTGGAQSRMPLRAAAESIVAADLLRDITFLASDDLAGRATPSPGQDAAAKYIEDALRAAGVTPFGDNGTYRQHYTVTRATLVPERTALTVGTRSFSYGTGISLTGFLTAGVSEGGVVYVGTGIRSPKLGWDPYAGLDVKGKWLLVHAPDVLPSGVTRQALGANGVDYMLPMQEARSRGALGLLIAAGAAYDRLPRPQSARDLNPSVGWAYSQAPLPQVALNAEALSALIALAGRGRAVDPAVPAAPFAFDDAARVRLDLAATTEDTRAYNVIGVIPGADPVLKDEFITVSSHLDGAVGRNPVNGDAIYNAADDNASGSAGNLSIARALTRGPAPRRTVVLIWDTGEETGLWGSRHIAYSPMSDKIVAHLCVDMIGRSKAPGTNVKGEEDLAGPGEVFVVGPGVLSTQMDAVLARAAADYPYAKQNRKFDLATESFFYPRTDAAPYFERRIPYVEFFTGLHPDYHRPSDDVSKIDPAKMEAVARTVYVTLSMLANDDARPRMDKPLPESLRRLLGR
jgi:hypothetical protein